MIAKGVRFNAEKKQVGNYYSTKIWSFSMKAACCRQEIVIQTDPQNCEYVIISGAEKKTEEYDPEDAETLVLPSDADKGKLADPFYRLEYLGEDAQKAKEAEPLLVRMQRVSNIKHERDYALNRSLRAQLRVQKERVKSEVDYSKKLGLGIRLLPPSKEDAEAASKTRFSQKFDFNRKQKRAAINASSIFSNSSSRRTRPLEDVDHKLQLLAKRRKVDAAAVQSAVAGRVKPLSGSVASAGRSGCSGRKVFVVKSS